MNTKTQLQKLAASATCNLNEIRSDLISIHFSHVDFAASESMLDNLDFALLAISRFMTELADLKE